MAARRVLITGVSSPLGSRVAAAPARSPEVDRVVGLDTRPPGPGPAERIDVLGAAEDVRSRIQAMVYDNLTAREGIFH